VSVTAANSGGENGERIVYLGVSTEVAVCIAIASFIIGVGLTGALWCIHIRTGNHHSTVLHLQMLFYVFLQFFGQKRTTITTYYASKYGRTLVHSHSDR
jgi:hypothetical protein